MNRSVLLLFSLFIFACSFAQKTQCIRFVFVGEEVKPHGTLLICVDKYRVPTDKDLDSIFGLGIKTDKKTFRFLQSYIKNAKYLISSPQKLRDREASYRIFGPNGMHMILPEDNFEVFFKELVSALQERSLDKKIIEAFIYNYKNWKR